MRLFMRSTSQLFELDVEGDTTIAAIKAHIASQSGWPAADQKLVWAGKELRDSSTVAEAAIPKESTLQLMGEPPPPAADDGAAKKKPAAAASSDADARTVANPVASSYTATNYTAQSFTATNYTAAQFTATNYTASSYTATDCRLATKTRPARAPCSEPRGAVCTHPHGAL